MIWILLSLQIIAFTTLPSFAVEKKKEEALKVRDPFKAPDEEQLIGKAISELEMHPTSEFKMAGVITGPIKLRAMLIDPNGKTHFVSESMKIGQRQGFIKRIKHDAVVVSEKFVNVLGEEEIVNTEIRLDDRK